MWEKSVVIMECMLAIWSQIEHERLQCLKLFCWRIYTSTLGWKAVVFSWNLSMLVQSSCKVFPCLQKSLIFKKHLLDLYFNLKWYYTLSLQICESRECFRFWCYIFYVCWSLRVSWQIWNKSYHPRVIIEHRKAMLLRFHFCLFLLLSCYACVDRYVSEDLVICYVC